jgi:hypothetical protein
LLNVLSLSLFIVQCLDWCDLLNATLLLSGGKYSIFLFAVK